MSSRAELDLTTRTRKSIDYPHHKIHTGELYRAGYQADVGNGAAIYFTIVTPDTSTWLHLTPRVDGEAEFQVTLHENPDSATGGAAVAPKNSNRNSSNTSVATCRSMDTVTVGSAVVLGNIVVGGGKSTGGTAASEGEWILKQNTTYVVKVLNKTTGNNQINIRCIWYEHENRTD